MNKNDFGKLVRAYRKQRDWTQEELADRWGHTRSYVGQIERGSRKLDSTSQVIRLADILDIPSEKLEAIGRGIPTRQEKLSPGIENESVLHILLSHGREMVQLSWIAWVADQHPEIESSLRELVLNLEQATMAYHGEFLKPSQQLLAYAHQMQGKIAFDRLDYAAAGGHFSEMIDLGQLLNDPDIVTLGMVQQADVLRKRERFDSAFRLFEAAKPYADAGSESIQGLRYMFIAGAAFLFGDEDRFNRAINTALDIVTTTQDSIDSLANGFSLEDVLLEQAAGYTTLWQPEKALEIYKETDKMRSFRPLRLQGGYIIDKSQMYLNLGDTDKGVELGLKGIRLASEYQSKRHIARMNTTLQRLQDKPIARDKRLNDLREALRETKKKQEDW